MDAQFIVSSHFTSNHHLPTTHSTDNRAYCHHTIAIIMKALLIISLLLVAVFSSAAAVPVESGAEEADAPKNDQGEAVKTKVQAGNLNDTEAESIVQVASYCPDGWFNYQTKCYMLVNIHLSWFNAEKHCNERGASLVSVGSYADYRYLQQMTRTANAASAWIGAFFLENKWLWIDGSRMYYSNWYSPTYPLSSNPCMYLQSTADLGWRNTVCGSTRPFICVHNYRC
ncbi:hypothetical protein DPEC_G00184180 [Dallia pectoralis]|uniref:Uncharacterized protein n=1 Tax=Dallia pectoralis TaxID=75939 RepID=A0ACC2GBA9_DALPE|nr:hypothetical protein DPEC_G00184180 [Dallia pectoralis]